MIELPEARILVEQLTQTVVGKQIADVIVLFSPHRFAWFYGDSDQYPQQLAGKRITGCVANCGQVELQAEDMRIVFTDGVNLTYLTVGAKLPAKHQLLIGFSDDSCIVASVQMYGGLWCFREGEMDNYYYLVARDGVNAMSEAFSWPYFLELMSTPKMQKKSVKAALATEQSIPGLGNGVLQDILYNARLHSKRKMETLSEADLANLFEVLKTTLTQIYEHGGRETERDLFGCKGGYRNFLSAKTAGTLCLRCGSTILKEAYLGGSIYYCEGCQPKKLFGFVERK